MVVLASRAANSFSPLCWSWYACGVIPRWRSHKAELKRSFLLYTVLNIYINLEFRCASIFPGFGLLALASLSALCLLFLHNLESFYARAVATEIDSGWSVLSRSTDLGGATVREEVRQGTGGSLVTTLLATLFLH